MNAKIYIMKVDSGYYLFIEIKDVWKGIEISQGLYNHYLSDGVPDIDEEIRKFRKLRDEKSDTLLKELDTE